MAWTEPSKNCTMGDKVKMSKSLFLWYTIQIPALRRTSAWPGKHGRCSPTRPTAIYTPLLLTIVHPLPRLGARWMSLGPCLDELIGKRCAAAPHRLSYPHQDTDLDNTPRHSRPSTLGVGQVWKQLCLKRGAEKYCRVHTKKLHSFVLQRSCGGKIWMLKVWRGLK